ncbi:hypothetical protein LCGC14_3119940, partial [marine sediment metagenome]
EIKVNDAITQLPFDKTHLDTTPPGFNNVGGKGTHIGDQVDRSVVRVNIVGATDWTDGSGIKDLNSQIIIIKEQEVTPICPTCLVDSVWSNCEEGKQIKIIYICSSSTNYQCVQTTETLDCQVEPIADSDGDIVTCEVGWMCKDENNLAYQSSDCTLSSVQECSEGCDNKGCKFKPEIKEQFEDNLTIEILPPEEKPKSFFAKIIDFIKGVIDALIFWDWGFRRR